MKTKAEVLAIIAKFPRRDWMCQMLSGTSANVEIVTAVARSESCLRSY
jgi:hypothetical protein